jgi:competence protein ComEC
VSPRQIIGSSLLLIGLFAPRQIFSAGLQFSYACIIVVMLIFPQVRHIEQIQELKAGFFRQQKNNLLDILLLTTLVSIYVAPLTLYYFHQAGLNGVLANLPGIPLMALLLPLAMLILLLPFQWWVPYEHAFQFLNQGFSKWTDISASLPFYADYLYFPTWQLLLGFLFLFLLSKLLAADYAKKRKLFACYLLLTIFPIITIRHPTIPSPLLTVFDVGLGDCSLLQVDSKLNMMIDTGPIGTSNPALQYDVLPYLKENGIRHLQYLVLTHPHNDHTGGADLLLRSVKVDTIFINNYFAETPEGQDFLHKHQKAVKILQAGDHFQLGEVHFYVLHPASTYQDSNPNNTSLVLRIDFHLCRLLFPADIEESAEQLLCLQNASQIRGIPFIKVPHHGSATSGDADFISLVHPQMAIIPASQHTRFRFPNSRTVEKYQATGAKVFITGKEGALQFYLQDFGFERKLWKNASSF